MTNADKKMVSYDEVEVEGGQIAVITLDRPEARNAQNKQMTYELNDAFDIAAREDAVKVIILAANGPDFSSGHDCRGCSSFAGLSSSRADGRDARRFDRSGRGGDCHSGRCCFIDGTAEHYRVG